MHGKFYHRACFQSMWRGGFEGEGRYYSPLAVCPLQRGRRHRAGRRPVWTPPGPGNPDKADEGVIRLITEEWHAESECTHDHVIHPLQQFRRNFCK